MKDKPVILVVDDQPKNIELLEVYLVPQGYEIVKAASGEEALGKLSGNQIDLMLLDVMMPGMDGFEVTRKVRQDNTHRLLPIILVTALREAEDRVKGIDAGCDDFISKPVDKMELLARIRSLLKVKDYNDLLSNYREELESEVTSRTEELKQALENLQQDIIARTRAEESLKESEEKYRGLVENISDVLYELDSQVVVVYISPVIRNMLGYDSAEIVGKNLVEFVYKDDTSKLEERFSELRKGIEFPFDYRFVNKSGELRWARTNTRPIMEGGLFKGARGTLIDVTDQKQLADALRESAEKYQRFFMTSRDCVFITSKEGSWIDMNDAAVELFGYSSREELMQIKISDLYISTEERTRHSAIIEERGYCQEFPVDLRRKDGTVMHTLITSVALCDTENNIIGFQGTIRDITERKKAEEALCSSEQRLSDIIEFFPDATLVIDRDGKIIAWNRAIQIMTGVKAEEMIGKGDYEYALPFYGERRPILIDLALHPQTEKDKSYTTIERKGDTLFGEAYTPGLFGGKIHLSATASVLRDPSGEIVAAIECLRDITDRKQAEEALRESEERYRSLFVDSRDAIMTLSPDRGFLAGNPSCIRMFACRDESDFVGRSPTSLAPEYQPDGIRSEEKALEMVRLALENGSHFFEWTHRRPDGTDFPATVLLSRIESGGTQLLLATVRDISAQKRSEEELRQTLERLRKAIGTTIQAMVSAVEVRDPYTAGHQLRSAELARAIAMEMGLPQEKTDGIRIAGSIHDIGKLSIPAEILSKPTKLSEIEFALIKEHSRSGYEMLKDVESPWPLAQIVYQHHERMNGSGYPQNLKGDEILMEARIMAVADVVESMASHRPYRPALGIDAALEEIEKNKGILYDEAVVDACLRLFQEKGYQLR